MPSSNNTQIKRRRMRTGGKLSMKFDRVNKLPAIGGVPFRKIMISTAIPKINSADPYQSTVLNARKLMV
jgi:hypothetical protein